MVNRQGSRCSHALPYYCTSSHHPGGSKCDVRSGDVTTCEHQIVHVVTNTHTKRYLIKVGHGVLNTGHLVDCIHSIRGMQIHMPSAVRDSVFEFRGILNIPLGERILACKSPAFPFSG